MLASICWLRTNVHGHLRTLFQISNPKRHLGYQIGHTFHFVFHSWKVFSWNKLSLLKKVYWDLKDLIEKLTNASNIYILMYRINYLNCIICMYSDRLLHQYNKDDFWFDLNQAVTHHGYTYIYFDCLSVCPFVSNKRQNVWIYRAKFCVGPHMAPANGLNAQNHKNLCPKVLIFVKFLKCTK